jgi:hypothetical protein
LRRPAGGKRPERRHEHTHRDHEKTLARIALLLVARSDPEAEHARRRPRVPRLDRRLLRRRLFEDRGVSRPLGVLLCVDFAIQAEHPCECSMSLKWCTTAGDRDPAPRVVDACDAPDRDRDAPSAEPALGDRESRWATAFVALPLVEDADAAVGGVD